MRRIHEYGILKVAFFVIFLLMVDWVVAQDSTQMINLENVITATLQNNKEVQLAKMDEAIAAAGYKQTEAYFLPELGFSYTTMTTNNPLNAFGFKLEQQSITPNDFNPTLLNHPAGTPDFTTKVELQQPLVNIDLLYMRKAALKQTELYGYKTKRTREWLTFEATKTYLQLQLAYDALQVMKETLETIQSLIQFTENHYRQGLIQKSDLLNVQVQLNTVQTNLSKAKSDISNTSDYLSLLMGKPTGIVYMLQPSLVVKTENDVNQLIIAGNRSDFMAMQKAIEASDLMIKANKMSYLPRLNAYGSYQLNDSRMLGFAANSYLAGVQLSWNILNGNQTKNNKTMYILERNKLSQQLVQQKEQAQLALNKTNRDIEDGKYAIKQQQAAVEQASEALRILQNRYQLGLVNTADVLMATTQLTQQKFALAQAYFSKQVSKAYQQFLSASN